MADETTPPAPVRAVSTWRDLCATAPIWYFAACAREGWTTPDHAVISEADYLAAIHAVQTMESC